MSFLLNAHRLLLFPLIAYLVFLICLTIPYLQRGAIYLHWIRLPIRANFDAPELYGLAPGKVRNFRLTTPDGAQIGVWHSLPEAVYVNYIKKSANSSGSLLNSYPGGMPQAVFEQALRTHKTVLYSHGNAASRAQGYRTWLLRGFSSPTYGACNEGMNFVIYDYRGFADSSPANVFPPSEEGLITDAKTVWDYIVGAGADPRNISIIGQSLGTGVSAALAHKLITEEHVQPKAVCLIAPFTSIPELLKTYSLFKVIPILQPLSMFPSVQSWMLDKFLVTKFDTKSRISSISSSIMLIHAQNDIDVDPLHSKVLFEFIHQHSAAPPSELPILLPSAHKQQSHLSASGSHPSNQSNPLVSSIQIPNYGSIHTFDRLDSGSVVYLDAGHGGHNGVGYSETALRAMVDLICN